MAPRPPRPPPACARLRYLLPLALALEPGHITAYEFIVRNFIPTTLGNWVGGAICVATVYAFAYGRPNKVAGDWFDAKAHAWRAAREARRGRVLPV